VRGRALAALARADEARASFQRALELDPGDAAARRLLDGAGAGL
jgi:predicted RNA polymerase sigma factor